MVRKWKLLLAASFIFQQSSAFKALPASRKTRLPSRVALSSSLGSTDDVAIAADALELCKKAAATKDVDGADVFDALTLLEKSMRTENKVRNGELGREQLTALDGAWRLIFTTGTAETQKKIGRINYFPIKAVQTFDCATMKLSNGIFLGEFTVIQFFGPVSSSP